MSTFATSRDIPAPVTTVFAAFSEPPRLGPWFPFPVGYLLRMSDRITIGPEICNGRPAVRGTRITVQTVLEFLGAGDSIEDVVAEYPALTCEDLPDRLGGNPG